MSIATLQKPAKPGRVYSGPIFDADTHLYETPDAWTRYFPKDLQERWGISTQRGADGDFAFYVGPEKVEISVGHVNEDGRVSAPGKLHEWLRAIKEGRDDIDLKVEKTPDMVEPAARLASMDRWGVSGCLNYIGNMVSLVNYLEEADAAYRVLDAYNHWMLDQWRFNYENRIFTVPVVSLLDLDRACEQVSWIIKNGGRAIMMQMGPVNGRAPADTYFDRFWSIVNEAGVRVVYHVGEAYYMKDHMAVWGEPVRQARWRQTAFLWMHGFSERPVIETLSSFVFWNFFERFPNIKIMSAENGAEWVPATLVKMDKCRGMAKNGYWPGGQLKERPSTIFKRNIGVVAYPEDDLKLIVEQAGSADWLMMGSDYPHAEGVEEPRIFADEACRDLTEQQTREVMYLNGMQFMGLDA